MTFKAATSAEIDLLAEFMREFYALDQLHFDEPSARTAVDQLLGNESLGRVWLVQVENVPVGYVVVTFGFSLEFHGRDALIDEIYVQAPHRGQGIGAATVKFVEQECRLAGIRALHLEVDRHNEKAQSLYLTSGFEDRGNHLMTKRLLS